MRVEVDFEVGKWTVRLNGYFLCDFWRKAKAYELAHRLEISFKMVSADGRI